MNPCTKPAVAVLAFLLSLGARATELPDLSGAFANYRYAEIERLAAARLAEKPDDPAAALTLGRAIVERDDRARFKQAEARLATCVEQHPEVAACHLWLGRVYGKQIDGMLSGLRLAPKTRAGFERAVELDPRDLDAQAALIEFYIAAPSALGGGVDKATRQIAKVEAIDAAGGNLLRTFLLFAPADLPKAEETLEATKPATSPGYDVARSYAWLRLGLAHFAAKRYADAQRVFEAGLARYADDPRLSLMLGRTLIEQGRGAEAISPLKRSAARMPTAAAEWRLGEALAQTGDRAGAAARLEAALAFTPALAAEQREAVQERLKALR
jgi:predicted Zn-dependent protease